MIPIRSSTSSKSNTELLDLSKAGDAASEVLSTAAVAAKTTAAAKRTAKKAAGEAEPGNVEWLKSAWAELAAPGHVAVVLVGGVESPHLRVRQAQSHLRHDFTPSHWSHVLMAWGTDLKQAWEVPLIADKIPWPTAVNGVAKAKLDDYNPMTAFPNVAVIAVPVAGDAVADGVAELRKAGRLGILDAVELLHGWLGFLWGVGRAANPLVDGLGLPSAAVVEVVLAGAGFELTPNVTSRASCPEAIWQSAKWWQDWHKRDQREGLKGAYRIRNSIRG